MREERTYLFDMRDAAELALEYVAGLSLQEFLEQTLVQDAVLYRIVTIGEAARVISEPTRDLLPELPWKKMVGMRNVLLHEYFGVDLQVAWDTVQYGLPQLVAALEKLLPPEDYPVAVDPTVRQSSSGIFLVLDGTEGSGKSTQAKLLQQRLSEQGHDVLLVRDPGATRIGEQIRAVLLDPAHGEMGMRCEMLLYMAARAQMMAEIILPALEAGKTVLCDRFVSSTLAYQLGGDGLTAEQIRAVAEIAIKGRWPDLTILLDMPPDKSLARVNRAKDRIEQRPLAYHEAVRRNYLAQAASDPVHYRLVPADRSLEEVHADVWRVVQELIAGSRLNEGKHE